MNTTNSEFQVSGRGNGAPKSGLPKRNPVVPTPSTTAAHTTETVDLDALVRDEREKLRVAQGGPTIELLRIPRPPRPKKGPLPSTGETVDLGALLKVAPTPPTIEVFPEFVAPPRTRGPLPKPPLGIQGTHGPSVSQAISLN